MALFGAQLEDLPKIWAKLGAVGLESGHAYAKGLRSPHKQEMVLSRGITGDTAGIPKVTCPMHKKSFSLQDGQGLSDDIYSIQTFEVKVEGDDVLVKLPTEENLDRLHICDTREPCTCFA